jgi:hypothetical protein
MSFYGTSSQLRSGGEGAIHTSGYEGSQFSSDDAKVLFACDMVDMIAIPRRAAPLSIFVGVNCAQKKKVSSEVH